MKVMGLVTARGGSKGVPGKNIKLLNEKPLLYYTLSEAEKSTHISRIVLSTDDERIAEVGRTYGAQTPFTRPAELGGDDVTDLPVFRHALAWLEENEGYRPDIIVHLRPTAPLRLARHIDKGIDMLVRSDADSLRSVCPAPKHPCKMWKIDGEVIEPFLPEKICGKESYNKARQALPPVYIQNGSVDVTRWGTIMEKNSMTGDKILGMLMDEKESVNIDTELDFTVAEYLLKEREKIV